MRCAEFHRPVKKTNSTPAATTRTSTTSKPEATPLQQHREPNSNLPTSPMATSAGPAMIRRSRRECTKNNQSYKTLNANSANLNVLQATSNSVINQTKPTRVGVSSASIKSQHHQEDPTLAKCSSVPQRANQSDTTRAGSGRHPYPPTGNNAKLKHKCPFDGCPWKFATPYKLRRHIKSHTKETPYLCKECGRGFSVRYNLLMHIQTIHSQPQKFKCPMKGCKEAFHSQSRLNGHLRRIHKKDWKTLSKDIDVKNGGSRGSSTSSMDSLDSNTNTTLRKTRLPSGPHKCPHCQEEFSSKVKLSSHVKTHAPEKPFKCIVQGCDKCFVSEDKLSRHAESHRNSKQFCCPHKNCNRIFLRQTHLRNHLKIHTQDHQFICPVLDCSQKFASESAYNIHLNTHINYGYSCSHPGCDLSFLSRKRLAIHIQVVHNVYSKNETGLGLPLLDGIQPHLGISGQAPLHSPTSPSLMSLPGAAAHPSSSRPTTLSCVLDKEFIKDVDLPGLSVDDIEAVLSQNEDWSGEQIDQFLRSAVDLSEIESKLSSLPGYESDSGYSTYDVSPMTSTAPANLNYSSVQVCHPSCPPSLALVEHATSPLFNNPSFTEMSLSHHSPSLIHDPTASPCTSDGGFFSPHSAFGSLSNTPNQESMTFFPQHNPVSMYPQAFSQPHEFSITGNSVFSMGNPFPDISSSTTTIPSFSLHIPDILLHDVSSNPLPCSVVPSSHAKFPSCSHEGKTKSSCKIDSLDKKDNISLVNTESVKNEDEIKSTHTFKKAASPLDSVLSHSETNCDSMSSPTPPSQAETKSSNDSPSDCIPNKGQCYLPSLKQHRYSAEVESLHPKKGKTGVYKPSKAKGTPKKKTQWPRSMNRANLIAFREHILNKLKKGQEGVVETVSHPTPLSVFPVKNMSKNKPSSSPNPSSPLRPLPIKCKASLPNPGFEVQVMYERNHMIPKRCHSEPADIQSFASQSSSISLHNCQSDSNIKTSLTLQHQEDFNFPDLGAGVCDSGTDLLSVFNFNPDTLLSSNIDEKLLDNLNLEYCEMENGVGHAITDFIGDVDDKSIQCSSSLGDTETMDIDCIQDLLGDSKQRQSVSSSSCVPPQSVDSPQQLLSSSHSPLSTPTPTAYSRSSSICSLENGSGTLQSASGSSVISPQSEDRVDSTSFKFPEILSVHGSMILDGVSVISDDGEMCSESQIQNAFLQSHHDPLLVDNQCVHASSVDLFEM